MFVTENTDFVNSINVEASKKQTLPKKGCFVINFEKL
jgi:hypothetical protein